MPIYHAAGNILLDGESHIEMAGVIAGYHEVEYRWAEFIQDREAAWRPASENGPLQHLHQSIAEIAQEQPTDLLIKISPPCSNLDLVYAIHSGQNADHVRFSSLGSVAAAVVRFLDTARDLGLRRVGLVPLNWCPDGHHASIERCHLSAAAVVSAISYWESQHEGFTIDVILYDLGDAFAYKQLALTDWWSMQHEPIQRLASLSMHLKRRCMELNLPQDYFASQSANRSREFSVCKERSLCLKGDSYYVVDFLPKRVEYSNHHYADVVASAIANIDGIIEAALIRPIDDRPIDALLPRVVENIFIGKDLRLWFPGKDFGSSMYHGDGGVTPRGAE